MPLRTIVFVILYPGLPIVVTLVAFALWRRSEPLFPTARTNDSQSYFKTLNRYLSSIPSIAAMLWLSIPAFLFSHFAKNEVNAFLRAICEIFEWPCFVFFVAFLLCALSISVSGRPKKLVPPFMR